MRRCRDVQKAELKLPRNQPPPWKPPAVSFSQHSSVILQGRNSILHGHAEAGAILPCNPWFAIWVLIHPEFFRTNTKKRTTVSWSHCIGEGKVHDLRSHNSCRFAGNNRHWGRVFNPPAPSCKQPICSDYSR